MADQSARGVLASLAELREDSKLAKSKHFSAATRKLWWHQFLGVPVIFINLLISIVITKISYAGNFNWISVFGLFLTFSAAMLSALQTFFNFQKSAEGHRSIGNRYLWISRQCKLYSNRQFDVPITPSELWDKYTDLLKAYQQINIDAEAFPTNWKDLVAAQKNPEITEFKSLHENT